MNHLNPQDLVTNLNWRYAVKKFDATKKIPAAAWSALEQSLLLTPSSYGLQPWKFVVVNDSVLRAELRKHAWNQPQITDASHLVVFARRTSMNKDDVQRLIDRISQVRGVPKEKLDGYRDMMLGTVNAPDMATRAPEWTARQAYIALGFFLSAAANLGIDACPMEGIDPAKFDEILGLKAKGYGSVVVATAGYRASDDSSANYPKVRFAPETVFEHR